MARFQAGCTALLALGFAAACAKDSPTGGEQLVGPDVSAAEASASGAGSSNRDSDGPGGRRYIAMKDDCDPSDPAWAPTGGCLLKRGNVTFAEFVEETGFPVSLSASVLGHEAWRNEPSYLVIRAGKTIRVRNEGGRLHTFTEVAQFGGGKVPNPALNKGLAPAPECPGSTDIAPGASVRISGLGRGNHRFQCCIHPWMRALVKVR
jgi:hypothetical protein